MYSLTEEHRAQLKPWGDLWTANAMSTKAMDDADRAAMRVAVRGMYEAAGLKPPPDHRIVFVPSPFVLRLAGGHAAGIWYLRNLPSDAGKDVAREVIDVVTNDAILKATYFATAEAANSRINDVTKANVAMTTGNYTMLPVHGFARAVEIAMRTSTYSSMDDAAAKATNQAVMNAIGAAVLNGSGACLYNTTKAIDSKTSVIVFDILCSRIHIEAIDEYTRDAIAMAMENFTYKTIDTTYNDTTKILTWHNITSLVDNKHYADVPSLVDQFLYKCAQKSYYMWNGGNQWSGWVAYISFFRHVAKLPIDYSKWEHYEAAAVHGGPRIMHKEFCMISDRPEVLTLDEQHRPHNDSGPFCQWRDGSCLYAIHGVRVPGWIVTHPQDITIETIDKETNQEIRRVMVDRYGTARYLIDSKAEEIHRDDWGILYRKDMGSGDEPLVMVKVVNSTPEPDGSRKDYFLRVPPDMTTAREAVAWTFDKNQDEYNPEVMT
jgi:hypothetical protein